MSNKERGLFRIIFKEFIKSLTPRFPKTTCVGEDYFGTKYFEVNDPKSIHKKPSRYFKPVNKSQFDQEMPAEWEAWLRHRRDNPPTKTEVNQGYVMILTKRENAKNLKSIYSKEDKTNYEDPKLKSVIYHASQTFPIYEEYKDHGKNDKNKNFQIINIKKYLIFIENNQYIAKFGRGYVFKVNSTQVAVVGNDRIHVLVVYITPYSFQSVGPFNEYRII